jgi:acetoin utilization protein AcuB
MKVGERMTKSPQTVSPAETLANTQERMHGGGFRQMPVVDNGKLVGIITDRDIRKHGRHMIVAKVQTVMTEKVITVSPTTPLEKAARILLDHKIGGIPVVEREKLVGIITTSDVLQAYIDMVAASEKG